MVWWETNFDRMELTWKRKTWAESSDEPAPFNFYFSSWPDYFPFKSLNLTILSALLQIPTPGGEKNSKRFLVVFPLTENLNVYCLLKGIFHERMSDKAIGIQMAQPVLCLTYFEFEILLKL